MREYQDKLQTHIMFLRSSCINYDNGVLEEALRIAVSLRVIFYDSKGSKSILSHLEKKRSIKLISTFDFTEKMKQMGLVSVAIMPVMVTSSEGVKPPLDSWGDGALFTVKEWLEEIIWKESGISMTRWNIIDSAANQDGGAHVDSEENLSEITKKIKKGFDGEGTRTTKGVTVSLNFKNHHYPILRQFAHEVLKSSELTNLVN